jgi:peroxiredoxin
MYIVTISRRGEGKVDFRVKVRETPPVTPVSIIPVTSSQGDSAVADLAAQGMSDINGGTPVAEDGIAPELNTITGGAAASAPVKGSGIGERALDFTLTSDTGETITLSDLQGKVVLLNFWGTWCGPCRREMPEFQALYEDYADQDFEIVAVAVRDTPEAVRQFREEFGLTFPLVLDENQRVNDLYAIPGQPSTFVLDKNGVIVFQSYSVVMREDVEAAVKAALE